MELEHRIQPEALAVEAPLAEPTEIFDPKHQAALEKLEQGYERATSEEGFRSYLKVVANLHDYSVRNMMLVFSQDPDATMVSSYDRWKEAGRQVRKGEKGLQIFYPRFRHIKDDDDIDPQTGKPRIHKILAGFGIGSVFDVRQTDGPPLERPNPSDKFNTTDVAGEIDKRVSLYAIGNGLRLEKKDLPDALRGFYSPTTEQIVLNANLPDNDGKLKTLTHEVSHWASYASAGHDGRDLSELIAEGSAFATLDYFGIDTSMYSFDYLAHWTRSPEVMKLAMPEIAKVTKQLIEAVSNEKIEEAEQWL